MHSQCFYDIIEFGVICQMGFYTRLLPKSITPMEGSFFEVYTGIHHICRMRGRPHSAWHPRKEEAPQAGREDPDAHQRERHPRQIDDHEDDHSHAEIPWRKGYRQDHGQRGAHALLGRR